MVGFLLHIIFVLFKIAKNVFIFVFYIVVYIFKSTELVRVKKDRSVRSCLRIHLRENLARFISGLRPTRT